MRSRRAPADIALALGVEKLKDTGYGGLPLRDAAARSTPLWSANGSAPGNFAQLAARLSRQARRLEARTSSAPSRHVSVKSHANGAKNPKAHLQKADHRGACASTRR